jgi:hypothetical protein
MLIAELKELGPKIKEYKILSGKETEALRDTISRIVCRKFGVSPDVVARRIRSEKISLDVS